MEPRETHPVDADARPIWETISELGRSVPENEWAAVPTDLAAHLDHYLHGQPKGGGGRSHRRNELYDAIDLLKATHLTLTLAANPKLRYIAPPISLAVRIGSAHEITMTLAPATPLQHLETSALLRQIRDMLEAELARLEAETE